VKAEIERLITDTGADELIVVTDTYEHADRLQSYQRLGALAKTIEVEPSVHAGA
jgi:electron transfer flavoprotein alpha/beta subunit